MNRLLSALLLGVSAPLAAHEGMSLDGGLHRLLHALGTTNVVLIGGALVVGAGWWGWRRRRRARPTSSPARVTR